MIALSQHIKSTKISKARTVVPSLHLTSQWPLFLILFRPLPIFRSPRWFRIGCRQRRGWPFSCIWHTSLITGSKVSSTFSPMDTRFPSLLSLHRSFALGFFHHRSVHWPGRRPGLSTLLHLLILCYSPCCPRRGSLSLSSLSFECLQQLLLSHHHRLVQSPRSRDIFHETALTHVIHRSRSRIFTNKQTTSCCLWFCLLLSIDF